MTDDNDRPGDQPERPEGPPEQEQIELGAEETVGEMLLAAREGKGLVLEAVSQETKIPVATLKHLETDNFEAIPAKVYATGFLRTYAQVLGLDPTQIINKYEVQTGQTHRSTGDLWEIEEEVVEEKLGSPRLLKRFIIPAILVVVAIIILWRVFGGGKEGAEPPPALPGAGQQSGSGSGGGAGGADGSADETGEDVTGTVQDRGSAGAPAPVSQTDVHQPQSARREPEAGSERPAAGEMSLRIVADERIWFDLVVYTRTASGVDSLETDFILEPGESRTFTSNEYFYIRKIGKTEGFTIELDGKPYEVPIVEGRLPRDITIPRTR